MNEDLLDYWIRIIKPLLPANAWVASRLSGGDYIILIDWKLVSDPCQPGKRSRKIEIMIKEDVIDDYLDKNKDERTLSDLKMKQWISEQYQHFTAYQDANPVYLISPEKWRVSKDVLSQ